MKTRLPISTISFNSESFLRHKLEELRKGHIIAEWYFILHRGEDDEAGKRDHIHLYMLPAKSIQTEELRDELIEYDPENPDKPRKCLSIRNSKFGNWFLYAIHDPDYLASKNESRRYHYRKDQVIAHDDDVLNEHYREIDIIAELGAFKGMKQAQEDGLTFQQFFAQGHVPVPQIKAFQIAWEVMLQGATYRDGRAAHLTQSEDGSLVDPDTGEVVPW